MNFDRLGTKVRPGTSGEIEVGKREYQKSPSVKKHKFCSDPNSADPDSPFPTLAPPFPSPVPPEGILRVEPGESPAF